ncbi:C2 calcium-dependent membrane targeting [Macleaya cordata]|uniref:C2 calcium-dependent membrane targeting n=1 Tax=Macleaya cordata TaxID=56857 RepID=A0A200Q8H9_MACCD|nr:C2 calcium-dependent membrane targeting [Macleaya cordata]OVA06734.1 C2 calcium-dependent membrane targeting [Macleaya cordata]
MAFYSSSSSDRLELEIKICSAKDLKNVNWRHGDLKPYAVVWVDPKSKCSTKVDEYGDTCPTWDETLVLPLSAPIDDSTYLSIDIVHANAADDTKPLIGSARVPLNDIVDDVGIGEWAFRKLQLTRPSGRPQGKLELEIKVRECRYRAPDPYYAPPYGVPPPPSGSRDYPATYPYYSGGAPPAPVPGPYPGGVAPPPAGYPYNPQPYGQNPYPYGQPPEYGQTAYGGVPVQEIKKKDSKLGVGTGLAVGAVAGVLGGLALAEGVDYVEDKIADDVAERVEDDLGYDDDDGGYGGDDF